MADKPIPDDRAMMQALQQLKSYTGYKARQTQKPVGEPSPIENDLTTIETWADDAADDGTAWGDNKEAESNRQINEGDKWNERVRQDEQQAAAEADQRSKLDVKQLKEELKTKLDEHAEAYKALAEAGDPDFKKKLPLVKRETEEAKQFIDQNLEKSLEDNAKRNAERRLKRKQIAERAGKKADEGRKWKAEYGGQPEKLPAGQRADVKAALDRIQQVAAQQAEELQAFGAKAAPHVASMKKVQDWAAKLKPQVDSQGADLKTAKASGKSGVAEARTAFTDVENFQNTLEGEASDNVESFSRWSDQNTSWAKEWLNNPPSPKHRQWAEAWMKTQS
jgi:hypothetical protein